jgi:hypothetical protein
LFNQEKTSTAVTRVGDINHTGAGSDLGKHELWVFRHCQRREKYAD